MIACTIQISSGRTLVNPLWEADTLWLEHSEYLCDQRRFPLSICQVTNVLFYQGHLYFIREDKRDQPPITNILVTHSSTDIPNTRNLTEYTVISPKEVDELWPRTSNARSNIKLVSTGLLWHRWVANNFFHAFENIVNLHKRACNYFENCEYDVSSLQDLVAIFSDGWGPWPASGPVAQAMQCLSAHVPLYLNSNATGDQLFLIGRLVYGLSTDVYSISGAWGPTVFKPNTSRIASLHSFRRRMLQCCDVEEEGPPRAAGSGPLVTILQRSVNHSRAFLNVDAAVETLQHVNHRMTLQVVESEKLGLRDLLLTWLRSDVVVLAHGAAMAGMMFARNNSAVVQAMAYNKPHFLMEATLFQAFLLPEVNFRVVEYIVRAPELHLNVSMIANGVIWKRLSKAEQETFIAERRCPEVNGTLIPGGHPFNKAQVFECDIYWLLLWPQYVIEPDRLNMAIRESLSAEPCPAPCIVYSKGYDSSLQSQFAQPVTSQRGVPTT